MRSPLALTVLAIAVLLLGLVPPAAAGPGSPLEGIDLAAGCTALLEDLEAAGEACASLPDAAATVDGLCGEVSAACDAASGAEQEACAAGEQVAEAAARLYGPGHAHWGSCSVASLGGGAVESACPHLAAAQRKSGSVIYLDRVDAGAACGSPGEATEAACAEAGGSATGLPKGTAPHVDCSAVGGAVGEGAARMRKGTVKFFNEK